MYQAYNGMGFSYRKTGDYVKALEMYDRALALKPGFPDAIEYRGEAYLGLNRVEDAKNAYLEVLAADRKQADTLMAAMQKWIEQKKANPAGVDPAVVGGLETWVQGRAELAQRDRGDGPEPRPALVTVRPMTWWTGLVAGAVLVGAASCARPGPPPDPPPPDTPFVWQLPRGLPHPAVPADNPMTTVKVALGRRLFYDTRLSGNRHVRLRDLPSAGARLHRRPRAGDRIDRPGPRRAARCR